MSTTARRTTAIGAVALIATAALAPAATASTGSKQRLHAVGLSDGGTDLVSFRTDRPGHARHLGEVTGLDGDAFLLGIDYRVQNGELYGVGDEGGLYLLDADDATASKVGFLTEAPAGTAFGVDFNPAANALRVVSDTGQNLRQPFPPAGADGAFADGPSAPTVVDGPLTNPAVPPATGTVPATGVTAAGYTNNDLDARTATTLFDLDTALDRVAIQSPANAGTLAPTGGLGVDAVLDAGLDVHSALEGGVTTRNTAFATLGTAEGYRLYAVDLLTGAAADAGAFDEPVTDLAIAPDRG